MRQKLGTTGAICRASGKQASGNTYGLSKPLTFASTWLSEYIFCHGIFEWGHYSWGWSIHYVQIVTKSSWEKRRRQYSDQHHSVTCSTGSWVLPIYLLLDLITWARVAWRPQLQLEGRRGIASWTVHFRAIMWCVFVLGLECRWGWLQLANSQGRMGSCCYLRDFLISSENSPAGHCCGEGRMNIYIFCLKHRSLCPGEQRIQ